MVTLPLGSFASILEVFDRTSSQPGAFWIDDAIDEQGSFMGCQPRSQLRVDGSGRVYLLDEGRVRRMRMHPLDAVAAFVREGADESSRSGVTFPHTVGFLAYDLAPFVEPAMRTRRDGAGATLAHLARYDAVLQVSSLPEEPDTRTASGDRGFGAAVKYERRAHDA